MYNTIQGKECPIKVWAPIHDVESGALTQLRNCAELPFMFKHGMAVMPDVHQGYGVTVGSVMPTVKAVVPGGVGVDIGCGMGAVKLPFKADRLPENLQGLFDAISKAVPVGQDKHKEFSDQISKMFWVYDGYGKLPEKLRDDRDHVFKQMGTLGGGNHFIEICLDTEDNVWVMLHSGSRGIGNRIGNYYIDEAKKIMKVQEIKLTDPDLAYLVEGTQMFDDYWRDLQWAQKYAMENRRHMMKSVLQVISKELFGEPNADINPMVRYTMMVNCHHNYAEREEHFGEEVIVTRKGAVRARVGDFGIIPGAMGAKSYIIEGLGNADSYCSCSHGAGRVLSRGKAKKKFTLADVETQTAGLMCRKDAGIIDELKEAYKDLDVVMENQKDLVKIVAQLRAVLCVKG
jgi:tRNA-splicing ligase RtcB